MGGTRLVLGPSRVGGGIPREPFLEPIPGPTQRPTERTGGFALEIATDGSETVLWGVGHGLSLRFWRAT
jgi:hypothetical protein